MAREARTVIIAHGSHTIRAGFGIHDVLKQPSIQLPSRVGLRRSHARLLAQYRQRMERIEQGQEVPQGDDADAAAATHDADKDAHSHSYSYWRCPVKPSDYLVGHFLEDAIQRPDGYLDDPVHIYHPMVGGVVHDWDGMQALWYHLLFFSLPVIRSTNSSVTLLSLPPQAITRASSQRIHKIFFEELNTPAFCLVDSALVSAFAVGQMGACVVDVGWRGSTISCVMDALLVPGSTRRCPVGMGECIAYLASQLSRDAGIAKALEGITASTSTTTATATTTTTTTTATTTPLLLELAEFLFREGEVSLGDADAAAPDATDRNNGADDEGNFDVLGALTSGKEKEAIEEQERRNRALIEQGKQPEDVAAAAVTGAEGQGDGDGDAVAAAAAAAAATTATATAAAAGGDDAANSPSNSTTLSISFKGATLRIPRALLSDAVAPLTDPSLLASVGADFLAVEPLPRVDAEADADAQDSTDTTSPSSSPPLLPPVDWPSAPSLPSTIAESISSLPDIDRRNPLWELLVITGAPTHALKSLTPHIISSLSLFVASSGSSSSSSNSATPGDALGLSAVDDPSAGAGAGAGGGGVAFPGAQPGNARALKTPDYFPEFKGRTDLAPFLGSTIYAKLVFADSQARGYTLKAAYSERGPAVAFAVSASEK